MLTAIIFIIILGALVLFHELGHFLVARLFKVSCDEFGIGFPPRAIGIYKKDGKWTKVFGNKEITDHDSTVYSINWIPLGGFVKIKGENGDGIDEPDSFAYQKAWKRALILSAGVIMNVIFAWLIMSVAMGLGLPEVVRDSKTNPSYITDRRIQVVQIIPNTAASKADLKAGDTIVSIDNQAFTTTEQIQNYLAGKNGVSLNYKIKRGQEIIDKSITPQALPLTAEDNNVQRVGIGVAIDEIGNVHYPWYRTLIEGAYATGLLLWMIITGIIGLFVQLFSGQSVGEAVAGPVGIATLTGQMVNLGLVYVLQFTAALSLNLAVINILPIPALDGGRLLFLAIEKVRGKPMRKEFEAVFHNIFFILLMLLVLLVTIKDISKLGCLSCQINKLINWF